jgi:hypothetical protein
VTELRPHLPLAPAATFDTPIRDVVLRGLDTPGERQFRTRAVGYLRRQLRCEQIWLGSRNAAPEVTIDLHTWQNIAADVPSFDRLLSAMKSRGAFTLVLWTRDWLAGTHSALEVLNRYQRWLPLPSVRVSPWLSRASESELDIWRWLMRLSAVARPSSELRRDAADLSFFSLCSWHYLKAHGRVRTLHSVEQRLLQMSEIARCYALTTRQPFEVSEAFEQFFEKRHRSIRLVAS